MPFLIVLSMIFAAIIPTDGWLLLAPGMEYREHVNSRRVNSYKSLLAFDPKEGRSVAPFRIFDLDEPGITIQSVLEDYSSAIQNLRLIKKPGINVWSKQDDFWSEAAIGEDKEGRILFIYSRSPFSM
jgi:hypothetical protein